MRILAHRGASGYAPENTFAAFELGTQMRADAIETDVRITRDNVLVLIHDEKVDRTTTGTGNVHELTWNDLQSVDAGSKYHVRFTGQRIPATAEFLDRFAARIPLCLELKAHAAVDPLLALLRSKNLLDSANIEFTSFEWVIVQDLHRKSPRTNVGYLTRDFTHELIDQVRTLGLSRICPPAKNVTPDLVARCHRLGLTVRTWGAKTREVLQHIINCKVDGTTLNHPDWICRNNGTISVVPESTFNRDTHPGEEL